MTKPELLIASSEDVPKGTFMVSEVIDPIDEGEIAQSENTHAILHEDQSLASRWIGWGIIRSIAEQEKQSLIITPKGTDIKPPSGAV